VKVIQQLETRMHPDAIAGFRLVIAEARVTDSILLPERAMTRMLGQVQWILSRVGPAGIRLTRAGYLPPAVVVAASAEVDWDWPAGANRESNLLPLAELRAHLIAVGLLRVRKGILLLTSRGWALAPAPRELWWHLARTIQVSREPAERDAITLLLVLIARRGFDEADLFTQMLALGLETLGWVAPDGSRLSSDVATALVAPKWRLLNQLGVFARTPNDDAHWTITPGGAAFARAALQTDAEITLDD
jgi:hypothetical protein